MDWTGGARRRFAPKKNNSTLQKQKAYFAKARAALNGPSQRNASGSPTRRHSASVPRSPQRRSLSRSNNEAGQQYGHGVADTRCRTHHSVKGRYRSPSDLSIPSRDRPSTASSSKAQRATRQQESRHPVLASKDGMDQEERLLLANRRRLLAQNDWIGLAPARPVHMKFSSSHDKDRVGKRRGIEKSRSKKVKPAGQRLLSPLFEERLQLQDRMMHGALLADNFQIRVGTDALATQTQQSRRSHNSGRTSMRQPSTEFEVLSEESMLLGPDEDNFDPFQVSYTNLAPQEPHIPHIQQLCEVANMSRSQYKPEGDEQLEPRTTSFSPIERHEGEHKNSDLEVSEQSGNDVSPIDEHLQHPKMRVMLQMSQSIAASDEPDNNSAFDQEGKTNDYDRRQDVLTAAREDEDEIWRNFMNVAQRIPSNPSVMALKSSSLHMTTSESSHRPVLDRRDKLVEGTSQLISTPKGAGTQGPVFLDRDQTAEPLTGSGSELSEMLPSPSKSLQQITKLATCTVPTKAVPQQKRDNNETWREFICGSQDESESSSQLGLNLSNDKSPADKATTLVPASASYIVSDLGTSDQTTFGGDTLIVEESLHSTNTQKRQTTSQHKIQPPKDLDSAAAQMSTSSQDCDDDSIEDDETTDKLRYRSQNIHTLRTATLNPNRFLPPQKRQRPPPKRSSNFLSSRKVRNQAARPQHSVYDLVDSDGNSIV